MECLHGDFSWYKDGWVSVLDKGMEHIVLYANYMSIVFSIITTNTSQIRPILGTYLDIILFLLTKWINGAVTLQKKNISEPQSSPQKRTSISPLKCVCVPPSLSLRGTMISPLVMHFPPWHLTLRQWQFAAQSAHRRPTSRVSVLIRQQLIIEPHLTALPGTARWHCGKYTKMLLNAQKCSSFALKCLNAQKCSSFALRTRITQTKIKERQEMHYCIT